LTWSVPEREQRQTANKRGQKKRAENREKEGAHRPRGNEKKEGSLYQKITPWAWVGGFFQSNSAALEVAGDHREELRDSQGAVILGPSEKRPKGARRAAGSTV